MQIQNLRERMKPFKPARLTGSPAQLATVAPGSGDGEVGAGQSN